MDSAFPVLAFLAFITFVIGMIFWHFSRSWQVLENWARSNGYRIVSSEYRNFFKGPFFWTSSEAQTVYYVTVETADGQIRSGWVRCGGWFWGLFATQRRFDGMNDRLGVFSKLKVRWIRWTLAGLMLTLVLAGTGIILRL